MATLQNTSTRTRARSTGAVRSSPSPAATTGAAPPHRAPDLAQAGPGVDRARLPHQDAVSTRCARLSAMATRTAAAAGCGPSTGAQATRPPEARAPAAMARPSTVAARARARSTGTSGSSAWAVSTYQASSGPESSARKTPCSAQASTKIQKRRRRHEDQPRAMPSTPASDQHRTAAQGVGQPPGRQLQGQHHEALGRENDARPGSGSARVRASAARSGRWSDPPGTSAWRSAAAGCAARPRR